MPIGLRAFRGNDEKAGITYADFGNEALGHCGSLMLARHFTPANFELFVLELGILDEMVLCL